MAANSAKAAGAIESAILHFAVVKKSRRENTFALSETVRSEVVPLLLRQSKRAGARVGDEGKAVGSRAADGFAI